MLAPAEKLPTPLGLLAELTHRCPLDLFARRHQGAAVLKRPAVILHVRDLDAAGAERKRQFNEVADALDVGAMHDRVDRERELQPHHLRGECALACKRAIVAGDTVGRCFDAVLDRNLHVVEAGVGERIERLLGEADGGRDEIGVEAGRARRRGDLDEVAPRRRLAAGEMHLQHAERRRLAEHPRPGGGIEFVGARI